MGESEAYTMVAGRVPVLWFLPVLRLGIISWQAVADMNGKQINGRMVYVGRAQKRLERQSELKRKFDQIKQERVSRYQVMGKKWRCFMLCACLLLGMVIRWVTACDVPAEPPSLKGKPSGFPDTKAWPLPRAV